MRLRIQTNFCPHSPQTIKNIEHQISISRIPNVPLKYRHRTLYLKAKIFAVQTGMMLSREIFHTTPDS